MFEERLRSRLLNRGYKRIDSNAQGIYLYYGAIEEDLFIVSIIQVQAEREFTKEQYHHILNQIMDSFRKTYHHKIQLLSLILTSESHKVKDFCSMEEDINHWIVDLNINRLIIYENQANDVDNLKDLIESALEEINLDNHERPYDQSYDYNASVNTSHNTKSSNPVQLTLVNSIIVIINIMAFVILHYTDFFGGGASMYRKGALSWYLVWEEKEYYRLLTSMFMHADISHLFNNMLLLFFIGSTFERAVGKVKYLFLYFGAGIIAGITSIGYNMWKENGVINLHEYTFSIGASGAIFGVVGAILFILVINKGYLEELGMRQVILFVILSLYNGIVSSRIDQAAHIGGFVSGFVLALIVYRKRRKEEPNLYQNTY